MTDTPKVSVVIPVYNGADFVAEAIDSALAQTYSNVEVVVINDGSCDGGATDRIARSYGDRIVYTSKQNGGVASALNHGVRTMTGEYFTWLSHDDLYTPDKVERSIAFLKTLKGKKHIVYSDYSVFSDDPSNVIQMQLRGVEPGHFRYWITVENSLHGCTLLIPRQAFDDCGLFNEALRTTQDYDLWFRMAKEYEFHHIPEMLVKARSHGEQGTVKMAEIVLRECNALLSGFTEDLGADELSRATGSHPAFAYAMINASLRRRGFALAAARAQELCLANLPQSDASLRHRISAILNRSERHIELERFAKKMIKRIAPRWLYAKLSRLKPSVGLTRASSSDTGATTSVDASASTLVSAVNLLPLKEKFSAVYDKNVFGGADSRSGAGSDLVQTEIIRRAIPDIVRRYGIRSFLDAPCGDWFWMQHVDLGVSRYIGADIVESMIEKNRRQFGKPGVEFACLDLSNDELPAVELIFSRDCLVHLSYEDALNILRNFKASGATYLLTTTFTGRDANLDLGEGFWRPLNMQLPPFNFPQPLELINEKCTEGDGAFMDKSLGFWFLKDLNL